MSVQVEGRGDGSVRHRDSLCTNFEFSSRKAAVSNMAAVGCQNIDLFLFGQALQVRLNGWEIRSKPSFPSVKKTNPLAASRLHDPMLDVLRRGCQQMFNVTLLLERNKFHELPFGGLKLVEKNCNIHFF